jgi:hypothetical protein
LTVSNKDTKREVILKMNNEERQNLRILQNKVIKKLNEMGYTDDKEKIINDITLHDIKSFLQPDYKNDFIEFLRD